MRRSCASSPRHRSADRPSTGPESLQPHHLAALYLASQGLSLQQIARQRGVTPASIGNDLRVCRNRLGAEPTEERWAIAQQHIEHCLPTRPLRGIARRKNPPRRDMPLLTKGQAELLTGMAQGHSIHDAAAAMGISDNTAYVHLKNARDRVGVTDNADPLRKARELGLLGGA